MRVLVVEDDQNYLATVVEALLEAVVGVEIVTARSRESAFIHLATAPFDLVICDLKLPTQDGALDEDVQHGLAVHGRCRETAPGTPLLILTAFGTLDLIPPLLTDSPREDFFGNGRPVAITDFVQKGKFDDFVAKAGHFGRQLAQLQDIEVVIEPPARDAPDAAKRILRILARRNRGRQVRVREFSGGLSSAETVRVQILDGNGATTVLAVGKLGKLDTLESEKSRYQQYVAPLLQPGSFAPRLDEVRAGAGDSGGLFYSLADDFDRSLFEVLASDPRAGAGSVAAVRALERRWLDSAQRRTRRVGDVRSGFVGNSALEVHREALERMGGSRFEERDVTVNECCQHRDLHGLNVLVGRDGRHLLIDYGEVGVSAASHDPVSLELCLLFHPQGRAIVGAWPSPDQARRWANLDEYVSECLVADFVRACRGWARDVSAGSREVCVHAYSYALRQLKYADSDSRVALALAAAAIEAFERA